MNSHRKVAFISPVWTIWQHRMLSGALRYADGHPRIVVRAFTPSHDLGKAARAVIDWGADGILGYIEHGELGPMMEALQPRLPVANCCLAEPQAGVVSVLGDFEAFIEIAVNHLRHLGLRSLALLVLEEGHQFQERMVKPFLAAAKPSGATLTHPVARSLAVEPEAEVTPVPEPLADWLRSLPKPVGILCPHLGGGGYVIRCCKALGMKVPDDVAVIGSDDTDLSLACEPTVTSVLLDTETVGFEAMRVLVDMMTGIKPPAATIRLKCAELHVRDSTGRRRPEICDIAGALECIRVNARRGITVAQVIRQTQRVSRVTFHRRFQEVVGKTPAETIREHKLQEARRLLSNTELPLGMVSDLCGFSHPRVLSRLFRATEGVTPRDFRKATVLSKPSRSERTKHAPDQRRIRL